MLCLQTKISFLQLYSFIFHLQSYNNIPDKLVVGGVTRRRDGGTERVVQGEDGRGGELIILNFHFTKAV